MPRASPPTPAASDGPKPALRRFTYKSIYPLRMLGMALAGLPVGGVLYELQSPVLHWAVLVLVFYVWPHVAYLHAHHSRDPFRAEIVNLLIDSSFVGLSIVLMHFCVLPSAVLFTVTTVDKLSTGIRRVWLHSLPGMLAMALLAALVLQPAPVFESSLRVTLLCLPLFMGYSLAAGAASYRLIRTVARQNRQLEELGRRDVLTGLFTRGHWQEQADASLRHFQASGEPACMLMIDIDHFKPINDELGHTAGDEVIRAVGQVILDCVRQQDCAGRYGGDEFAVVCSSTESSDALAIAQRIRERIEALRLARHPQLRLTSSIGLYPASPHHGNLRDWMNDADAALYRSKHAGRNQVSEAENFPAAPEGCVNAHRP